MVKRAVGTKACLLGKAVTCKYLRQDNFLEVIYSQQPLLLLPICFSFRLSPCRFYLNCIILEIPNNLNSPGFAFSCSSGTPLFHFIAIISYFLKCIFT